MDKKCLNCREYKNCRDSYVSWIVFIIGMIATIALRAVTVLMHLDPVYGQLSWYIGVTGFFIFFVYKFKVDRARYRLITQRSLMERIARGDRIEEYDRRLISQILCSVSSNKDRINYLLIFVSSAAALIFALYFDFLR
ncbi:MAG: hypothetical protein PHH68_05490 [Candidatus Omnitrophica bacterium]|jgi:hypothetical protein|nr:hypothetical protein [Candidatus Omnitrophota bacterium]MDD5079761.1 hypothetical protein [Candidatus Omnitrophota bacterium]